jgi:ribosome-associated toxin RatA of RatAB toxin-antitoxin module
MLKNMGFIILFIAIFFSSGTMPASAAKMVAKNSPWPFVDPPDHINYNTLIPLLEKGEMNINYFNTDGTYKQATVFSLISAPPEKVWPVVVDFDNYPTYMPRVGSLEILKRDPTDTWLYYGLEIPGPNYFFTVRTSQERPKRIDFIPEKYKGADLKGGWRYELYPVDNGKKTVLVFKMYCDTRDQSWFLRQIMKMDPTWEMPLNLGINLSTGILNLQAIKRKVEGRN